MTDVFAQPSGVSEIAGLFGQEIKQMLQQEAENAPRSRQKAIGPSEIGVECPRRLAYRLLDWPQSNVGGDKWAIQVGRAVHAFMEETFRFGDPDAGRYLVERKVNIRGPISGSADLYDRRWATVFDWKVVGESTIAKTRANGPSNTYRTQAHLYGLGFKNQGEKPERVAIVFLPRAASLDSMYVWTELWDEQVALDALDRLDAVTELLGALDVESHPERWKAVPAVPTSGCSWCPWFLPGSTDLIRGCPGPGGN